ncbi:uncharacterized protein LOC111243489 isoform X2 [Varroa destructor]|uniref:Uncharacterized protein n=1 Tax=Varroa destructor TaxID=109461 RepID=A0A7M7J1S2_VARDE|nr:uncharacterized protein LOC111243489 isoform X2 [Varroa destructor]
MSYIDIFQAHTKEMLEEYKKSMSCYIETHLISLKKKADRINNQNEDCRRAVKTEEDAIHLTMLNKLINRLDESTISLAANVVKLRSFQQYQINAADLANVRANVEDSNLNQSAKNAAASLERHIENLRKRQATLENDLVNVKRRRTDFATAFKGSSRRLDAEDAGYINGLLTAELQMCRASAEKEIRQFRGELALAIAERRREIASIEAEAKRHHRVHAECDKLLKQEDRRFNKLEAAANKRLAMAQKTYEELSHEFDKLQKKW